MRVLCGEDGVSDRTRWVWLEYIFHLGGVISVRVFRLSLGRLGVFVYCAGVFFVVGILGSFHCQLVSTNQTTNEHVGVRTRLTLSDQEILRYKQESLLSWDLEELFVFILPPTLPKVSPLDLTYELRESQRFGHSRCAPVM